ncbi:MAG: GTP-binding protein [Pseudomonadota bacterium]
MTIESNFSKQEHLNIVIVGHVDHGKSTVIGRLLADSDSLPEGKLEIVRESCRRNSKPFEYAFLLDAFKDEQAQGITIDSARVFFQTEKRKYIIIDAPGHIEFLRNMVTGASRAEAALLVIDAKEGVQANSKRHAYLLSMLGIKQVAVLINKMDLIAYDENKYNSIVKEYKKFLLNVNIEARTFIPVSGIEGDCVSKLSDKMNWYNSKTVLEILDTFDAEQSELDKAFRMPVQGVYKFTQNGDNRRIIAGTIETGKYAIGDTIMFYPSLKKSKVKTIEYFQGAIKKEDGALSATGFTLEEQVYIKRGDLAVKLGEQGPRVSTKFKANVFWLGKKPIAIGNEYLLKLCTTKVPVKVENILSVINSSNLEKKDIKVIEKYEVGECIFKCANEIAFDLLSACKQTSRFVLSENFEISGGGIIIEEIEDSQKSIRDNVKLRNINWEIGEISRGLRAQQYKQKPKMIIITGEKRTGRKDLAKILEKQLFMDGRIVYFLRLGNIIHGLDADIPKEKNPENRHEHIRRLAEVANIMLDSGILLIVTAQELTQNEIEMIKTIVGLGVLETVWVGKNVTTDLNIDLHIEDNKDRLESVCKVKELLLEKGVVL